MSPDTTSRPTSEQLAVDTPSVSSDAWIGSRDEQMLRAPFASGAAASAVPAYWASGRATAAAATRTAVRRKVERSMQDPIIRCVEVRVLPVPDRDKPFTPGSSTIETEAATARRTAQLPPPVRARARAWPVRRLPEAVEPLHAPEVTQAERAQLVGAGGQEVVHGQVGVAHVAEAPSVSPLVRGDRLQVVLVAAAAGVAEHDHLVGGELHVGGDQRLDARGRPPVAGPAEHAAGQAAPADHVEAVERRADVLAVLRLDVRGAAGA